MMCVGVRHPVHHKTGTFGALTGGDGEAYHGSAH